MFSYDTKENQPHYDRFADKYDLMQSATGFNDPYELTLVFLNVLKLPLNIKIMDFGCGTGLLGEYLTQAGFSHIYGLDGSRLMLNIAE